MANQHLFEALQNVCDFTALETDLAEIMNAYQKDRAEEQSSTDSPIVEAVAIMRKLQKDYFNTPWEDPNKKVLLSSSKIAEKKVDALIAGIKSNQISLL